ncbi:hypothetical protein P167DRAFT_599634 [Morchella conica CCBAS932]|uniref:Uncharacterized protein n=1 Tax=Morchella conica CCBAS932 TaxID=1392247 RepID=A0A3N4K9A3_9PEZI|nr:hypothetical protein P167DRAFT_599634 [Morchella conica CCBAS932]
MQRPGPLPRPSSTNYHPHPPCLIPGLRPPSTPPLPTVPPLFSTHTPPDTPLLSIQPLFTPHPPQPHAATHHPSLTRAQYIDQLLHRHSALRTDYIALKAHHQRLVQQHANGLNPGRNPTVKVYKAAPVVVGLVGWLEGVASGLESLLDEVNVAERRAGEVLAELMKVDRELQEMGVPVTEG